MSLPLTAAGHICQLYEGALDQKAASLELLKQGLASGQYVFFVSPQGAADDWYFELQAYGVDVAAALREGRLAVSDSSDWYQPEDFNSIRMTRRLWRTLAEPLAKFDAVTLVSDMSWTPASELDADQLCHWEATADLLLDQLNTSVVCQYDLKRHSVAEISGALRTHPLVLLDGRLVDNPFCEARHILENEPHLNQPADDPQTLETQLQKLRRLLTAADPVD